MHPTLKNETDPDKVTVAKIAMGAQVFYNYTGATKCLRLDGDSTGLGADFWDLQVRRPNIFQPVAVQNMPAPCIK